MPKLGMEAIRRRQVMDAVIRILSTQGWRDLTIREVSDVAGISSGVVTHYFANKRTLTLDAINDANLQFVKALGKIERRRGGAVVRLAALADFVSQLAPPGIPDWRFWLGLLGRMPFDRVLQAEVQKLLRLYAEIVTRMIEHGVEAQEFTTDKNPADIAAAFVSAALGFAAAMIADPQDMPPERCRRLLLDLLQRDLSADFAAAPRLSVQSVI
ncbi:TetR/AcrR family transcriptional regulator [Ancylobacter sp. VNQ12]|uniref:TetR/AcrR family transcriptional regulator n=1 Tax=Ancylobacter sp. VNQ12 TaxID=3400920 RepID=UPI003C084D77